jgi:hypothetical protein
MVPAIHSVKYHFSILQEALTDQRGQRIRLSKLVRTVLADWLNVTSALAATPAPITMLVPTAPMAIGATDACIDGMGGGGSGYQLIFIRPPSALPFGELRSLRPFSASWCLLPI